MAQLCLISEDVAWRSLKIERYKRDVLNAIRSKGIKKNAAITKIPYALSAHAKSKS